MNEKKIYKITILFLLGVIILQWIFMATRPRVPPKAPLKIPPESKGVIAIVIDDWGYNANNLEALSRINSPLTCSILPHLAYSKEVAEKLHERGMEVILHLPMEPHEQYRLEKNTILVSMDAATIRNIIEQDLNNLGFVKGVSNHMGSLATEDSRTMQVVFKELKMRNLYFLDSFVTSKSICPVIAHRVGLRFSKRDVFLDNLEDPGYIKKQIYKLKIKARTYGQAVGIGHDRRVTLEVLGEVLPELKKEGYKFVFVSQIVR